MNTEEKSETKKLTKRMERVFDHFWTLEEQQTILGLLRGKKMKQALKKKLQDEKEKNV